VLSGRLAIVTLQGEHAENFNAEGIHRASSEDNMILLFIGKTVAQFPGIKIIDIS
jgi:hypothetical protein